MGKFEFIKVIPENIRLDPSALKYLQDGATNFGGIQNVENILSNYDENRDLLIIVKNDYYTVGSIYLTFTQQEIGKVMTSVLLGGDKFGEWASELSKFYYKLADDNQCDEFMLMGRRGFKKYFPELREVATVFKVSLI